MPSRSFYNPPDFRHIVNILTDYHGAAVNRQFKRFQKRDIAPLIDQGSLPHILGISSKTIFSIRVNREKHYRQFLIPRKGQEPRTICAPRTYLKVIQWWLLDNILCRLKYPQYVKGFVIGESNVTNAEYHYGAKHILNMDIKDFFPTIREPQIYDCWRKLKYSDDVAEQLTDICSYQGSLPQGALTSPSLANLFVRQMDINLNVLAKEKRLKFTRYAADLTFSSRSPIDDKIVNAVEEIVNTSGFHLNPRKTRFRGLGSRMEVTGLVINDRLQLPREWRNRVRAIFHQATLNPEKFVDRIDELNGYVGAIANYSDGADEIPRLLIAGRRALDTVKPKQKD